MARRDVVEALDRATEAWEMFTEAMWKLGREVQREDHHLYERVSAYPGWDGTRDVGAGQSMEEWLAEIGRRFGVGSPGDGCVMCGVLSPSLDDDGECPDCVRVVVEADAPAPVVGPSDHLEMEYEDRFVVVGDES